VPANSKQRARVKIHTHTERERKTQRQLQQGDESSEAPERNGMVRVRLHCCAAEGEEPQMSGFSASSPFCATLLVSLRGGHLCVEVLLLLHKRLHATLKHAHVDHGEGELEGVETEGGHGEREGCGELAVVLDVHQVVGDGGAGHGGHAARVRANAESPGDEDGDPHREGPGAQHGRVVLQAHDDDDADDVDEGVARGECREGSGTEHHRLDRLRRVTLVRSTTSREPLLCVELGGAALAGTPQRVAEGLGALRHLDTKGLAHIGEVGTDVDGAGAVHLEHVRDSCCDEQGEDDDLDYGSEDDDEALTDGNVEHLVTRDAGLAAVDGGGTAGGAEGAGLRQGLVHVAHVVLRYEDASTSCEGRGGAEKKKRGRGGLVGVYVGEGVVTLMRESW
jgi:hypothetical protein